MALVSCSYAPSSPADARLPEGVRRVVCIDDEGRVWQLNDDSDVGDWVRYIQNGGTVAPYEEPQDDTAA